MNATDNMLKTNFLTTVPCICTRGHFDALGLILQKPWLETMQVEYKFAIRK